LQQSHFIAVAAYAEGDNTLQTDNQTAAFSLGIGAKVRLLQLENSIDRNIMQGEAVLSAIKERNASADTSEPEALLAEMKVLRDEVASVTPAAGDEAARQFVELKEDAIELTKEFREPCPRHAERSRHNRI